VKSRIGKAKLTFKKRVTFYATKTFLWKLLKKALKTYVTTILYYGSETWTINKRIEEQLEATEMWS
jgi:hypothetical protein